MFVLLDMVMASKLLALVEHVADGLEFFFERVRWYFSRIHFVFMRSSSRLDSRNSASLMAHFSPRSIVDRLTPEAASLSRIVFQLSEL